MATVYDMAVRKLTDRARFIAKFDDPTFAKVEFDRFKARFVGPNEPTYGLPATVLDRALKEAFYDFMGTPRDLRAPPTREKEP